MNCLDCGFISFKLTKKCRNCRAKFKKIPRNGKGTLARNKNFVIYIGSAINVNAVSTSKISGKELESESSGPGVFKRRLLDSSISGEASSTDFVLDFSDDLESKSSLGVPAQSIGTLKKHFSPVESVDNLEKTDLKGSDKELETDSLQNIDKTDSEFFSERKVDEDFILDFSNEKNSFDANSKISTDRRNIFHHLESELKVLDGDERSNLVESLSLSNSQEEGSVDFVLDLSDDSDEELKIYHSQNLEKSDNNFFSEKTVDEDFILSFSNEKSSSDTISKVSSENRNNYLSLESELKVLDEKENSKLDEKICFSNEIQDEAKINLESELDIPNFKENLEPLREDGLHQYPDNEILGSEKHIEAEFEKSLNIDKSQKIPLESGVDFQFEETLKLLKELEVDRSQDQSNTVKNFEFSEEKVEIDQTPDFKISKDSDSKKDERDI